MTDITKCADFHCPSRDTCLRFTSPSKAEQTYADFGRERRGAKMCDHYMRITPQEKRRQWQGSIERSR